jgi:hypothetical protein
MRVCDGCGAPADEAHIRGRIERLELATCFRPIHIQVLLLDDAPAARPEDYFYRPASEGSTRSPSAKAFFREMLLAAGISNESPTNEEAALAEFQRRGYYLADAVECPIASLDELRSRVFQAVPTIVKRVEFSYRPKHVVPIGAEIAKSIDSLRKSSIAERIIMPEPAISGSATLPVSGDIIAAALARTA